MFRFMAFVWDSRNHSATERAHRLSGRLTASCDGWISSISAPGVQVFCKGMRPGASTIYPLHNDSGVVLGSLWARQSDLRDPTAPRPAELDELETRLILESGGRRLTDRFWGRYVALLHDRTLERTWILRDPTGCLPCYLCAWNGVTIAFSALADLQSLNAVRLTVNWAYIAHRIFFGIGSAEGTGLEEVIELRGGQCREIGPSGSCTRSYWNPFTVAECSPIEDRDYATAAIRSTVFACTRAWAAFYPGILLRLSGGLDSSIIAACLSGLKSRLRVTAVTYYIPGGNSDERPYARIAAEHAGLEHLELPRNCGTMRFSDLLSVLPTPRPITATHSFLEFGYLERELSREYKASAICTGDPGDIIFGSLSRKWAAADFFQRHPFGAGVLGVAAALAPAIDASFFPLLWQALGIGLRTPKWNYLQENQPRLRTILGAHAAASLGATAIDMHPWFRRHERAPRGLSMVALGISMPFEFYHPLGQLDDGDPEWVYPLFSQPLVELCLRIPSYIHAHNGLDRELVRHAFRADVPEAILRRYWKDRAEGQSEAALRANIGFTREMLLDGFLVKEAYLDRRRTELVLRGSPTKGVTYPNELIDYLLIETWLRLTSAAQQRIAA